LKDDRRISSERPDTTTAYSNTSFQVRRWAMFGVVVGEWKGLEVIERGRGEVKRGKKRGDIMMEFTVD
jgi:hypothetical protein